MMKSFNFNEDVVTTEVTVTDGFGDGGVGILAGTSLTTASLSDAQDKYYYNLQYNSKDHLSVLYGHINGSGSMNQSSTQEGETKAIYGQFFNLLETEIRIEEGSESLDLSQVKGKIIFEKVSFSYPGRELVVDDFDLGIKPGSTQAIVGPTGSGKTTLIRLLLRFHVPNSGSIFLDGKEISKINLKDLRSSISLVTQTITLFPGTVLQNIAYGNKEYSKSQIVNAAKVAEIHDFVESLPDGYSTQIGEGGHKLSGGQRQRISIARAVLKDAPILVLDEATSSVDNETEEALQKSLDFISKNRTTIVIAHRLSTIRHSDSIIVLDGGKVVEAGNHDELIANKSNYYRLWNVQTGVRE